MTVATIEDAKRMLVSIGAEWPAAHPETDEPFTGGSVMQEVDHQRVRMIPPGPRPQVTEDVYDDEGCYAGTRELSEQEYADRVAAWERYRTEYERCAGQAMVRGNVTISGDFETDSGATASGIWAGEWHWQEWSCTR